MSQTIKEWLFHTLNTDSTLAALWGDPTLNPFSVAAQQGANFPYCIYSVLHRKDTATYGNPRGPGKDWVFSFKVLAQGDSSAAGADQAWAIFNRIDDIFGGQMDPIGVQLITLELGPVEHWYESERSYQIVFDYRIKETLCNLV